MIEVLIAILGLVIILVAAGDLLWFSQRASQRQEYQVEARQTARAATDYANYLLRGATDFNTTNNNAGAIVVWLYYGGGTATVGCPGNGCVQATYDNLTAAQASTPPNYTKNGNGGLGDPGTDIITFGRPSNPQFVSPVKWPGFQHASTVNWEAPSPPCPCASTSCDNQAVQNFCSQVQMSSCDSKGLSPVLLLIDAQGNWAYYQITGIQGGSDCSGIHVTSNAGQSGAVNPPGGQPDLVDPRLVLGATFTTLRVCRGWLEQKDGIFDGRPGPTASGKGDDTDAGSHGCDTAGWNTYPWTPLLPNVEDFQIAYLFQDGTIWNDTPTHRLADCNSSANENVPCETGACSNCPGQTHDISHVIAFRVTVTAKATSFAPAESARFLRPVAENHAAGTVFDRYYRYQASTTAMIRNRAGGM